MAQDTSLSTRSLNFIRETIERVPASKIGEVAAIAFGDKDIVPLWFGEGDLTTPAFISDATVAALRAGETFYTYKLGIPPLREALAQYLTGLHAKPVAVDRVKVTSAGMSALMLAGQTLVDPGDNVIIVSPVWPNINAVVQALGGQDRPVGLTPTHNGGWTLDLDRLFAATDDRTRAIFVNSPSNPTGWTATTEELDAILQFARQRGIWVISDEVYSRIHYERAAAPSILDVADPEDRVIVVNSFSKAWAMTGWRIGWMVTPAALNPVLDKMIEFNTSGTATFIQHGAVAAVRDGEPFVKTMVERCRVGRDIIIDGLSRFPRVRVARPEAAFYAFFAVDGVTDSLNFAKDIVRNTKVGIAPGIAFGPAGEGYIRLCFASSPELLEKALVRLKPMMS